jgi:hypothetical protein
MITLTTAASTASLLWSHFYLYGLNKDFIIIIVIPFITFMDESMFEDVVDGGRFLCSLLHSSPLSLLELFVKLPDKFNRIKRVFFNQIQWNLVWRPRFWWTLGYNEHQINLNTFRYIPLHLDNWTRKRTYSYFHLNKWIRTRNYTRIRHKICRKII